MHDLIQIQSPDFNLNELYKTLIDNNCEDGAIVTFTGQVRQQNLGDNILGLHLEHYPGMTEKMITEIVEIAREKWVINRVVVVHRVGQLNVGENIVFVGVTGPHRSDSYAANEFIMDFLKVKAPFWKKEITPNGGRWLEAKTSDQDKAKRWIKH